MKLSIYHHCIFNIKTARKLSLGPALSVPKEAGWWLARLAEINSDSLTKCVTSNNVLSPNMKTFVGKGWTSGVGVLSSVENKINTLIYRRNPTAILSPPQARRVSHFHLKQRRARNTSDWWRSASGDLSKIYIEREASWNEAEPRSLTCNLSLSLDPILEARLFTTVCQ